MSSRPTATRRPSPLDRGPAAGPRPERRRAARSMSWSAEEDVDLGPRYGSCDPGVRAWAARLARVLLDRPVGADLFFHAAHRGVLVIVTEELDGDEGGAELMDKSVVRVKVRRAEIGEP